MASNSNVTVNTIDSSVTATINKSPAATSVAYPTGIENSPFRSQFYFKRADYVISSSDPIQNNIFSITLPIPKELNQFSSIRYNSINMGSIMGVLDDVSKKGLYDGIREYGSKIVEDVSSGDAAKQAVIALSSIALKYFSPGAAGALNPAISKYSGFIRNPRMTELFEGVNLRNYFYSWHFSPDTAADSPKLRNLENMIQSAIHPEENNTGTILQFPFVCEVRHFFNGNRKILPMPKQLVVTDFRLFYVENNRGFYDDGQPIVSRIEMNLTEMSIRTAKDFVVGV